MLCYHFAIILYSNGYALFFTAMPGTPWDDYKVAIFIYLSLKGMKLEIYKEFLLGRTLVAVRRKRRDLKKPEHDLYDIDMKSWKDNRVEEYIDSLDLMEEQLEQLHEMDLDVRTVACLYWSGDLLSFRRVKAFKLIPQALLSFLLLIGRHCYQ